MSNVPRIIAICGIKRCGKDTLANYIEAKYGYEHVKISQRLKDMMQLLFGFSVDQMETNLKEVTDDRWGVTPRCAMQFFGTEIMQFEIQKLMPDVGRNFWIQDIIRRYVPHKNIVISDLRFIHEWHALRQTGVDLLIVRIHRSDTDASDTHVSETEQKKIQEDVTIGNDNNIESLHKQFDEIWRTKFFNQIESLDVH